MYDGEYEFDIFDNETVNRSIEKGARFVMSDWFFLLYLPILNFMLIVIFGKYILSGIMYPYQNSIIREELDRSNATKFGQEFAHYL